MIWVLSPLTSSYPTIFCKTNQVSSIKQSCDTNSSATVSLPSTMINKFSTRLISPLTSTMPPQRPLLSSIPLCSSKCLTHRPTTLTSNSSPAISTIWIPALSNRTRAAHSSQPLRPVSGAPMTLMWQGWLRACATNCPQVASLLFTLQRL